MIEARVTAKSQITIPLAIRRAMGVREGDKVVWRMEGKDAIMSRQKPDDSPFANPLATFTEWADEIDTEDFADF